MSWTTPGPASAGLKPFINELVFVMPGGLGSYQSERGVIPTVRVTMVPITGPQAGEVLEDVIIFATRIVQRLRGQIGQVVFGQVREIGRAMDLEDPGPMGHQFANGYDQANPGKLTALAAESVRYHEQMERGGQQPQQQGGWSSAAQQVQQGPPPSWATAPYGQQQAQPVPSQPPPWNAGQAPVQPAPSAPPANVQGYPTATAPSTPQPSFAPQPAEPVRPGAGAYEQATIVNPNEQPQTTSNAALGNGASWSPANVLGSGATEATAAEAGF